jgi:hypothetical protein
VLYSNHGWEYVGNRDIALLAKEEPMATMKKFSTEKEGVRYVLGTGADGQPERCFMFFTRSTADSSRIRSAGNVPIA